MPAQLDEEAAHHLSNVKLSYLLVVGVPTTGRNRPGKPTGFLTLLTWRFPQWFVAKIGK